MKVNACAVAWACRFPPDKRKSERHTHTRPCTHTHTNPGQAMALKDGQLLRNELEEVRAAVARSKRQYEDMRDSSTAPCLT